MVGIHGEVDGEGEQIKGVLGFVLLLVQREWLEGKGQAIKLLAGWSSVAYNTKKVLVNVPTKPALFNFVGEEDLSGPHFFKIVFQLFLKFYDLLNFYCTSSLV